MAKLGKIENVNPRDVWKDEARDFTPWVASDIGLALLGETLGLELELVTTESRKGKYKCDVVARVVEDEEERIVVIENQLEQTDHPHLGKIVTYASGHNAVTAVWIARSFSDEHRQALDWLNVNMPDVAFFALEIGLIKIGDSQPAPQFKLVSSPNEWTKAVRASHAREVSDVKLDQLGFWQEVKDYAAQQPSTPVQFGRTPRPQHWLDLALGRTGFRLTLTVNSFSGRGGCEVYMYDKYAKQYFDLLYQQKDEIESELEYPLEWQRLDDKKSSRIAVYTEGLIENPEERIRLKEWLFEKTREFYQVLSPKIQALEVEEAGK